MYQIVGVDSVYRTYYSAMRKQIRYYGQERHRDIYKELAELDLPFPQRSAAQVRTTQRERVFRWRRGNTSRSWKDQTKARYQWGKRKRCRKRNPPVNPDKAAYDYTLLQETGEI